MMEYEQTIEDIRALLASEVDPKLEVLRDLDERYSHAVVDANLRLRNCDNLLHKGHRSEAIQSAEVEPNLLELVAVLNFTEVEVWTDFVKQFGLSGPPALLTSIAEHLATSYAEEVSLADLMRQHRQHALGRSPLRTRLNIVRRIAERDPGNPIWQEDIRNYEHVRLNQIQEESDKAIRTRDVNALAVLEQEVRSSMWVQKPAVETVQRIIQAHTDLRIRMARQKLESVSQELCVAHKELDVPRGRMVREAWNACKLIASLGPSDPLVELTSPAIEWLLQADLEEARNVEYRATLDELEKSLEDRRSYRVIESLFYKLGTLDREIPESISRRVYDWKMSLETNARRRNRLVAFGIACTALACGVIILWQLSESAAVRFREEHVGTLSQLIDGNKLVEARNVVETLRAHAEIIEDPAFQSLIGRLESLESAEHGRVGRLSSLLATARKPISNWEEVSDAFAEIKKASELAANNHSELSEVDQVRREIETVRDGLQADCDRQFAEEMRLFIEHFGQVKASETKEIDELDELKLQLAGLQKRPHVSPELKTTIPDLVKNIDAMRSTEVSLRGEAKLLKELATVEGDRRKYETTIKKYFAEFPTRKRAIDLNSMVETDSKLWDEIELANAFVDRWSAYAFRRLSASDAKLFLEQTESLSKKCEGFPAIKRASQVQPYVKAVLDQIEPNGQPKYLQLVNLFTSFSGSRMAAVASGDTCKRYYVSQDKAPRASGLRLSIEYYTDPNFSSTKNEFIDISVVVNKKAKNAAKDEAFDWEAPQAKFGRLALDMIATQGTQTSWESRFQRIIELLDNETWMEPILKVKLLEHVLILGCEGSEPMRRAYKAHMVLLASTIVDDAVDWVDPQNSAANNVRSTAVGLLKRLGFSTREDTNPDLTMAPKAMAIKIRQELAEFDKPDFGHVYSWLGCLHRSTSVIENSEEGMASLEWDFGSLRNSVQHRFKSIANGESVDLVAIQSGLSGSPTFVKIGAIVGTQSGIGFQQIPNQALVEGSPVFAKHLPGKFK
jgi:hypothetical protein